MRIDEAETPTSTATPAAPSGLIAAMLFMALCFAGFYWAGYDIAVEKARFDDYAFSEKTILNADGMGWWYPQGADCYIHVSGDFTPLGTFQGQPVFRYINHQGHYWECPTGALIHSDEAKITIWKSTIAQQLAAQAAEDAERLALTAKAKE